MRLFQGIVRGAGISANRYVGIFSRDLNAVRTLSYSNKTSLNSANTLFKQSRNAWLLVGGFSLITSLACAYKYGMFSEKVDLDNNVGNSVESEPSDFQGAFSGIIIGLNHVWLSVDDEYFELLEDAHKDPDSYLNKELSTFKVKTNRSGSETWRGAYFTGQDTYLEILKASELFISAAYNGIAFSHDSNVRTEALFTAVNKENFPEHKKSDYKPKTINEGTDEERKIDYWFRECTLHLSETFEFGVMQYHQDFLNKAYPGKYDSMPEGIPRSIYNEASNYDSNKRFRNVIGIKIAVQEEDCKGLVKSLTFFGYQPSQDNKVFIQSRISEDPLQIEIETLKSSDSAEPGIRSIKFSMNQVCKIATDDENKGDENKIETGIDGLEFDDENRTGTWSFPTMN